MRKGIWMTALLLSLAVALSACTGTVQTADATETQSALPLETAAAGGGRCGRWGNDARV